MNNAINWFEIPVSDIDRAKTFYEAIFGFEMHSMDVGDDLQMAVFPSDQDGVGGSLIKNSEYYYPSESKGPLVYLNGNPDLQKVLDKVEEAGGKISIAKRQISPDHGFMAVIIDSEGNRIALHSDS
jgi:predicted enzyme related to lactoylglutathione lyase